MNRAQRRAQMRGRRNQIRSATSAITGSGRVPVFGADDRLVDTISPRDVERYRSVPNARIVRDHVTGETRVILDHHSDDSTLIVHRGNPRRYSHDHETEKNPPRVWTLRPLQSRDRAIYQSSILDCITEERKQIVAIDAELARQWKPRMGGNKSNRVVTELRHRREKIEAGLNERLHQVYEKAA